MSLQEKNNLKTNDKLFIIDASSIIFRSYYAIKNSKFNVLYGFVSTFRKILEQNPKYIISTLDVSRHTFRNEIYKEYKANRSATPEDLKQQIPYVLKFLEALKIHNLSMQGFEADDLIASIVDKFSQKTSKTLIVTKDKDLMQLVKNESFVYDIYKDFIYDRNAVFNKYTVYPEQILDFLAIVGDSSDNIPGVKGIGEKGASAILKEFKSIEELYKLIETTKHIENLSDTETNSLLSTNQETIIKKYKRLLLESKEQAFLSKKLASLVNNLELPITLNDSQFRIPETKTVTSFLSSFGLRQETARYKELLDRLNQVKVIKQKNLF